VTGSLAHRPGRRPDQPVAGVARGGGGTAAGAGHARIAASTVSWP